MFSKFFGRKKQETVEEKKEPNNVGTENKIEADVLPDNSSQSKCVDRILNDDVYKTHWAHIEYDLIQDKDILITLKEIMEVDGIQQNFTSELAIVTLADLQFYIHNKELQWLGSMTIEDARVMYGIEFLKCHVSGVRKGSQWQRLFETLKKQGENIELKIEPDHEGNIHVYCKRFGLDTNSAVEMKDHGTYFNLIFYHEDICENYFKNNVIQFVSDDIRQQQQFNLVRKLFDKANLLNKEVVEFYNLSSEHNLYFFSHHDFDFKSLYITNDFWKDFDWSTLNSYEGYLSKCEEMRSKGWSADEVFHYMAYNICWAINETNKTTQNIIENYPEGGFYSYLEESLEDKFKAYIELIDNISSNSVNAGVNIINRYIASDNFIRFLPSLEHTVDKHQPSPHNNKVYSLVYLAKAISNEPDEELLDLHINSHKIWKDAYERKQGRNMEFYDDYLYSFMLVELLSNIKESGKNISELSIINYHREWSSLSKKEKTSIKLVFYFMFVIDDFYPLLNLTPQFVNKAFFWIVFNSGSAEKQFMNFDIFSFTTFRQFISEFYSTVESTYKDISESPEATCNSIITIAQKIIDENKFPKITSDLSSILEYSGSINLEALDNEEQKYQRAPLILGTQKNSQTLTYGGEGSLVTIAPPRSGKSRSQVIPNLKGTEASVFVIDPKGECFSKSENERMKIADGRVYKFSPFDEETDYFNPLEFIDRRKMSEDSKFIANLIIPDNSGNDENAKFFRDLSVDFLSAVIVAKKLTDEKDRPCSLSDVGDLLLESELKSLLEVTKENRQAHKTIRRLIDQPEGTLQGVLATTQRAINVWEEDAIHNATSGNSDWSPESIKLSGTSIYICFPPAQIEAYSSVIRVLASLHIREALKEVPEYGQEPDIVFFLDELPSLGYMKPVEDAVYVGAQYGIRAWLFAQTIGQLKKLYANAEGLIGACDVRCFMNPSQFENIAKKVSDDIGFNKDPITGERKPIISEHVISSEKYKDKVFIFRNTKAPVIVDKYQEASQ